LLDSESSEEIGLNSVLQEQKMVHAKWPYLDFSHSDSLW